MDTDPQRLDRLRARIREADLAAAVLVHPPNLRYLVGFHSNAYSRPLTLVVPVEGDPTLLVPRLEELQAREMTGMADIRSYVEWDEGSETGGRLDTEWLALLVRALSERGLDSARLGLERAVLTGGVERSLVTALPKVAWSDASGWVERLRLVKSPDEIEHHRRAGQLAAAGLTAGFAVARAGGSELEISAAGSGPWRERTGPLGAGRCQAAGRATCERMAWPSTCRCGRATASASPRWSRPTWAPGMTRSSRRGW